ncbi:MAG: methyltransferase domain-containing protein [Rhodothermales bacterium]
MRLVQHKKEAYWFYSFLSIFYDNYVNPFFWNARMRDEALTLARLDDPSLDTLDAGAGTGFTTEGIVAHIDPAHVTCLDQSPHQLARARAKSALGGCTILEGDAEDLPFPTDRFDRYVSAGSIEYWPDPQRGIAEAYRVLKPGGVALMVGPLRPETPLARAVADAWMLFPEEEAYERWFRDAGFTSIRKQYVAPTWVRRERYGIAISGVKPKAGPSPLPQDSRQLERLHAPADAGRILTLVGRLALGSIAGFLFIPAAMIGQARAGLERRFGRRTTPVDPIPPRQAVGVAVFVAVASAVLLTLFRRRR